MKKILFTLMIIVANALLPVHAQLNSYKEVLLLMGVRFEFTVIHADSAEAHHAINAGINEVKRIEKLISSWNPSSQTSLVNQMAGKEPVKVKKELFDLISRSKKISELTLGAFDISFASMDKVWKFDGTMTTLPEPRQIAASVAKVNYKNIALDVNAQTVYLKEQGMKIGFGGIGKGYAANHAKSVMVSAGIANGIVNAGGDLLAWGKQSDGRNWRIGVADPKNIEKIISWLDLSDLAVVTSGNYEKYAEINGKKYAHIIDPRSGYPAQGLKSVTIICADAELADALATAVFVLGRENGIYLINQLDNIEGLLITENDEMIPSENLLLNFHEGSMGDFSYHVGKQ